MRKAAACALDERATGMKRNNGGDNGGDNGGTRKTSAGSSEDDGKSAGGARGSARPQCGFEPFRRSVARTFLAANKGK